MYFMDAIEMHMTVYFNLICNLFQCTIACLFQDDLRGRTELGLNSSHLA